MTLDPVSTEYIAISFAIDRLFPGFIDAYVGPPDLKVASLVEGDAGPHEIVGRLHALAGQVEQGDYPESRRGYLLAQIRAMVTMARKLAGETVDYVEEVLSCFDIDPAYTDEAVFNAAIAELDRLLPGSGDVRERMIAWRAAFVIPTATARRVIDLILTETRRRTAAFAPLPAGEAVEIAIVQDKPWGGYNWYLGVSRSRVDINTDLPIHLHTLTDLIAHEAYPGHHTEHALKEQVLYKERGYGEHAIQLINTPECVISEGIATLARSIIFPDDEGERWEASTLYPAAGNSGDASLAARVAAAAVALRAVPGNAALRLHRDGASPESAVEYLMRYALRSEAEARQTLQFISDPLWRAYIFTYHVGRDLLGKWLDLFPGGERLDRFRSLLTDQVTPFQIARAVREARP